MPGSSDISEMESQDYIYAQALAYRDGKVEGFTKSESDELAEKLFLQLADQGLQKAAHNYGSMMFKAEKYDLAYQYFKRAGLSTSIRNCQSMIEKGLVNAGMILVIGSVRSTNNSLSKLIDNIQKTEGVDLTHTKSFGGKAVTMDLEPVNKKYFNNEAKKHIVGDAKTFDFSGLNVAHVLIERPPVFDRYSPSFGESNDESIYENFVGQMVENVSKGMKSGAVLEIEWDPYIVLSCHTAEELQANIERNPFVAQFHLNHVWSGLATLNGELSSNTPLPPGLTLDIANDMAAKMKDSLNFFVSQGVAGYADILDVCVRENFWSQALHSSQGAKNLFVQSDPRYDSARERRRALSNAALVDPVSVHKGGFVFNHSEFLSSSFLNYLLGHIAVQTNQHEVKACLESLGFAQAAVERRTNVHNGRRNVWMVRAVKVYLCEK